MAGKRKGISSVSGAIIKLTISALLLVSVTTAWFIFTKDAKVEPLGLDVTKVVSVSVSSGDGNWSQNLEINHTEEGNIRVTEYSGNGKELYSPVVENKQVVGFARADESASNNGYIDFQIQFKADGAASIYLGEGSEIAPESLTSNLNDNKVSKNYIAGATRVAMWSGDSAPLIWTPNALYEYNETTKAVIASGTVEESYQYATDTTVENMKTISTNGEVSGVSEDGMFLWGAIDDNLAIRSKPVITFTAEDGEDTVKTLNVRVWVEGTDREAVKDLIGGRFKIGLKFTAITAEGGEQ